MLYVISRLLALEYVAVHYCNVGMSSAVHLSVLTLSFKGEAVSSPVETFNGPSFDYLVAQVLHGSLLLQIMCVLYNNMSSYPCHDHMFHVCSNPRA